jgi:creatinine amidohydrolase/Fe(II)-dependent formamide hydrolase-like protein
MVMIIDVTSRGCQHHFTSKIILINQHGGHFVEESTASQLQHTKANKQNDGF